VKTSKTAELNRYIGAPVTSSKHAVLTARHIAELPWKGRLGSRRGIHEVDGDSLHSDEPGRLFARHPVKVRTLTSSRPVFPYPLDSRAQTPGAVTSWQALLSSGNEAAADTQLGVSTTHVVVTTRTHIGFYNKAGQLQQPSIYVGDFFAPLGLDQVLGTGLTYFDTRSMFDEYRKRFWVGALAIKHFPDKNGVPADNLTKFAVAVSSTENPQDPWFLYWWDAVAHDGDPSSGVFQPGDWGDYPTLGIDAKCVYQTNPVQNNGNNRYCHVQIFPAWQMAAGDPGPLNGWQFWDLSEPDGTKATRLSPAVHHGTNKRGFFVGPNLGATMLVWGIQDPLGPTQRMDRAELPISSFAGPKDALQENSSQLIRTTNIATDPLRASCRDNVLSFSFNDGTDWGQPGGVISASRLMRIDLSAFPALPQPGDPGYRDRIFGLNNPIEDQPGDRFAYAWPAVDTNAFGDTVVVYNRTGITRDPEIRFSTWMNSEPDIRPSRLLKAGEKPYALSWVAKDISLPWADTAGVSVDPYDDVAIWFAHAYADSHNNDGNYAVWVGKVFGSRFPWIKIRLNRVVGPRHPRPGEPVEFEVQFENGGDGESPATRAHIFLVSDSPDKDRLLSLRVPEIRPAGSVTLRITAILPKELPSGAYALEVVLDPSRHLRQYSHESSTARLPLEVE
jgi:hypothetical protein